jgi:uncharacterized protein YaaR (DUF327 family)
MPAIIVLQRHSVENCPMNNEKMKKMASEIMDKIGALTKKHGIKMVGSWSVVREHLSIIVYEAPSVDAFLKFQMEPAIRKWQAQHTTEIKIAMTTKEAMKPLK